MDAQWLKSQFSMHPGKSKAALAAAIGLDAPAVSKILAGKRQIKAQEYVAMRRFFGLPTEAEKVRQKENAFVLSPLAAGNGFQEGAGDETGQWAIPAGVLHSRTKAAPEQVKIFQVKEHTMAPKLTFGDYVLVDLSDQRPSPPGVFVLSDGVGHLVRHCEFQAGAKPPLVRVSAFAPNFQPHSAPLDELQITGRVIARLEWL